MHANATNRSYHSHVIRIVRIASIFKIMRKKTIFISGMHCTSCEKLLEDELGNVKGVKRIKADRKKNLVEIFYEETEPQFSDIKNIVQKFGYEASVGEISPKNAGNSWAEWISAFLISAVIVVLFRIILNSGVVDKFNPQNVSLGYGVSFLVGLAASVSSCLIVIGSVIIAFSEKYRAENLDFFRGAVKPNLFFHTGRLATFFVLGGLLGFIGGEINISGNFVSFYTVIIAAIMALLGLNILGILPSNLGIMPKRITSRWSSLKESDYKAAPFLLGAMSFFLPCGFTQSMQILALTSGSFTKGSLSLFFFALGTVPSLLALGVATSWVKNKKIAVFQKVAGILILLFAVYTFGSGMALWGVKSNVLSSNKNNAADSQDKKIAPENIPSGGQTVEMHLTSRGYEPNVLKIKKGIPVNWIIYGDSVTGCTNKIIVPSLDIEKGINSGKNIIGFTPTKSGEIPFSCWMGMVRGKFIVE